MHFCFVFARVFWILFSFLFLTLASLFLLQSFYSALGLVQRDRSFCVISIKYSLCSLATRRAQCRRARTKSKRDKIAHGHQALSETARTTSKHALNSDQCPPRTDTTGARRGQRERQREQGGCSTETRCSKARSNANGCRARAPAETTRTTSKHALKSGQHMSRAGVNGMHSKARSNAEPGHHQEQPAQPADTH